MRISVQRVNEASIAVLNDLGTLDPTFDVQQIGLGLLLTVEIEPDDDETTIDMMANRVLTLRCFDGPQGSLPQSVQEIRASGPRANSGRPSDRPARNSPERNG